jgi:pyruvate dehydrogenase E2 component (dihydrolipoamide acetyltransferase)
MATDVKLPRLGQGMESGTIVRWLKAEGDTVEKGEPLYEVDTDKATQEVEAEASGVLLRIAVAEGEVPVGQTVALIGEPGESVPDAPPEPAGAAEQAPEAEPEEQQAEAPAETGQPAPATAFGSVVNGGREQGGGRVKASPLARRIARERGVDLGSVQGTGPDGRVVAEDVERAAVQAPAAAAAPSAPVAPAAAFGEAESVRLTNTRRTIARRLTEAWQVPVFQLTVSADMTRANALIARSRELDPDVRATVTDLIVRVCASALQRHPDVNVQFAGDAILRFPTANVGLAVAAPQGLVVPVIRSAERLSLAELATERARLVDLARSGGLKLTDLEGGTFTISNLGMFGVEQFIAVLNPPQAAILAVGATMDRPVAVDGEVVVRPMMTVTLTVDHRAVDGAPAADFLRSVKSFLEDPALAL